VTPLKTKKAPRIQALHTHVRSSLFSGVLEGKLRLLVVFAVFYGVLFINYIDVFSSGASYGYHLWLVFMYFLPFVGFSMLNLKNVELTLGLGLLASLMNDVFYGAVRSLFGLPLDLHWYYNLWLIPQSTVLFTLNLGFATVPVFSWMMALSIYVRVGVVVGLLWHWKRMASKTNR
jgi:hypothetical protein